jgi:HEAT repeat protein
MLKRLLAKPLGFYGFLVVGLLICGWIYSKKSGVADLLLDGPVGNDHANNPKANDSLGQSAWLRPTQQHDASIDGNDPLAMVELIGDQTSAAVAYEAFHHLKEWLARGPAQVDQAVAKLTHPGSGSTADKRQRSLVYGALAETNVPEAASGLVALVHGATTDDDLMQAVGAIADHRSPTQAALPALWHAYETNTGPAKNMSLLAFGSAAYHLERAAGPPGDAADKLLAAYAAMPGEEGRIEIISAMGNHGSERYFEVLKTAVRDQSELVRKAAVYALRFHSGPGAGALLADTATQDAGEKIKAQAIEALATQLDQRRDYGRVTKVALSSRDPQVQLAAAVVLTEAKARGGSPEIDQAIAALRSGSSIGQVQAFLGG